MNTVTNYIKRFMSEAKEIKDPFKAELDKLRKLTDPNEGSEFNISAVLYGEVRKSVSPVTGAYSSDEVHEDASGYLSIEKDFKNPSLWNWSISLQGDLLDVDDETKGLHSLEECFSSIDAWVHSELEDLTVEGLAE